MYDYLIVGAGLYGSVCAYELSKAGKSVLVIDKREHIGGNCYTKSQDGINVHKYGAHIFHTSDRSVWDYVGRFAEFNNYVNSPLALYGDELYNLPFNMNTFSKMWGVRTPQEAKALIEKQRADSGIKNPQNLEEQAIFLVGRDIYEKLIKGYTEKQWGRLCNSLPADIIKRLPLRFTYDNNYFNDRFQGIPIGGYTQIFDRLLKNVEVRLNTDFVKERDVYTVSAKRIIYTGMIDEYYDYRLGTLEYRSLRFEEKLVNSPNVQGNAVINYTDAETPYTRVIEHKHFEFGAQDTSILSYEYPASWEKGLEPFYPVNDEKNNVLYTKYKALSADNPNIYFGGRLGEYKYLDMDKTVMAATELLKKLL